MKWATFPATMYHSVPSFIANAKQNCKLKPYNTKPNWNMTLPFETFGPEKDDFENNQPATELNTMIWVLYTEEAVDIQTTNKND